MRDIADVDISILSVSIGEVHYQAPARQCLDIADHELPQIPVLLLYPEEWTLARELTAS